MSDPQTTKCAACGAENTRGALCEKCFGQPSNSLTTKATPAQLRQVLACALAYKKYLDSIKDRGEHPGERDAFMKGFNAGVESVT